MLAVPTRCTISDPAGGVHRAAMIFRHLKWMELRHQKARYLYLILRCEMPKEQPRYQIPISDPDLTIGVAARHVYAQLSGHKISLKKLDFRHFCNMLLTNWRVQDAAQSKLRRAGGLPCATQPKHRMLGLGGPIHLDQSRTSQLLLSQDIGLEHFFDRSNIKTISLFTGFER